MGRSLAPRAERRGVVSLAMRSVRDATVSFRLGSQRSLMRRSRSSSAAVRFARFALLGGVVAIAASCNEGIDTKRRSLPAATLGDDMFGVFCDRVGASSLAEDLSGASYHGVCHYDAHGQYADQVNESLLPAVSGAASVDARARGLAKLDAMVRRRSDLVRAFNALLPDIDIDDVSTPEAGDTVRLHDAIFAFGQNFARFYDSNPFDAKDEALVPRTSRAMGRLFGSVENSASSQTSFAAMAGRKGYRPSDVALGAVRSALSSRLLRQVLTTQLPVIGPSGSGARERDALLAVMKQQLLASGPEIESLAPYRLLDPSTAQPNRPRTPLEVFAALMRDEHPLYAASSDEVARPIVLRDRRGVAIPDGSQPGVPGTVPSPFVDLDADGFADVDAFGRFTDGSGQPLLVDPPFALAGVAPLGPVDAFGRPSSPSYSYVDTSRTFSAFLARSARTLSDPTSYGAPGDPGAYKVDHETLMYALQGAYALLGDREDAQFDFATGQIKSSGESCDGCFSYSRFRAEDSPLPDLVHAAGQLLADDESDAILLSLIDLVDNHEDVVARLVGAALRAKEIADEHDALADMGKEPRAEMPYATPIWDEVAEVLGRVAAEPGLFEGFVYGVADDVAVTPIGGSLHLGDTLARFMLNRDAFTYDPDDINGPAINVTDGAPSTADPHNVVNRSLPLSGTNRSAFQRSLQMIHDGKGVKACNKPDASVYVGLVDKYWPLFGSGYAPCELFQFDDLGGFYLDSVLAPSHPKRAELSINSGTLNAILSFLGNVGLDEDTLLESSSGITGLGRHPSPQALHRLIFFGASSDEYPSMPDFDALNVDSDTNKFISHSIEPVASTLCPFNASGVSDCTDAKDTLRVRDYATIFLWERLGFIDYLRPVVTKFANVACNADVTSCDATDYHGERMFVDLVDALHRHWSGKDHGPECSSSGNAETNPAYCSGAGVSSYEPILADVFESDLVPALHEFAKVAAELSAVTIARGPNAGQTVSGAHVLEKFAKILFDPAYAASVGMRDRQGNKKQLWVNGTVKSQLTLFNLFADALHKIDTRFDHVSNKASRQGAWKRARSQFVDELLAVDGTGADAKFKNRGTPRALSAVLRIAREQVNAQCSDRESGVDCAWARRGLGDSMSATVSGPIFAAMMDLLEKIRVDEPARRSLEAFLRDVLSPAAGGDSLQGMLATLTDMPQTLVADGKLASILNAMAPAMNAPGDPAGLGAASASLDLVAALTGDDVDRYHVLDTVMPLMVTPVDGGPSPLETFLDVFSDVNRIDAAQTEPLAPDDFGAIVRTVREFFTSDTRGLEQLYAIVEKRSTK